MNSILKTWRSLFHARRELLCDLAALLLRLSFGLMMGLAHGWDKLQRYSEISAKFPDPLRVGHELSMALAIFAELVCSVLVVLGLATRLALLNLIFTMLVAGLLVHASDAFMVKEKAFLYLFPYIALFLMGPGRFSLDHVVAKKLYRDETAA